MIPLNQIQVASPCHESWSEMDGDGAVRFCGKCSRNVYNLSEMTTEEGQALVAQTEGKLCVRFYKRRDGTLMTKDCPVGVRVARRRYVTALSWAASLAVAAIVGPARPANAADPPAARAFMGDAAMPTVQAKAPAPVTVIKVKPKTTVKSNPPTVKAAAPLATMGKIAMPAPPKPPPTPTPTPAMMGSMVMPVKK